MDVRCFHGGQQVDLIKAAGLLLILLSATLYSF